MLVVEETDLVISQGQTESVVLKESEGPSCVQWGQLLYESQVLGQSHLIQILVLILLFFLLRIVRMLSACLVCCLHD